MPTTPVYLDNHATTRTDPRVVEAMLPYFTETYGNPSAKAHRFGWDALDAVERAREQVARLLGAQTNDVVFTSGATEANNLAIRAILPSLRSTHLVTTAVEHRSVLELFRKLGREGWDVTFVAPDSEGLISAEAVTGALRDDTALVSVMAANNEVGTVNPLAEIGQVCADRKIVLHCDATQVVGKLPFEVDEVQASLVSLSGHKFHGPKGIGALYVSRGRLRSYRLTPLFEGGGQERGLRSGTVPVPLVVGLGAAAELARESLPTEPARIGQLRERLHRGLDERLDSLTLNGHPTRRLPGNLNLGFAWVDPEALMMGLRDVAVSAGAACTSANPEPSHVLRAMGRSDEAARASLRFGLSRFTTEEEVDFAAEYVAGVVRRLREARRARSGSPVVKEIDAAL